MPKAIIKQETREETILREYRHLRTIIKEEKIKLAHFDRKRKEIQDKIEAKLEVIKINSLRLDELRSQAKKIIESMLKDDE